MDAVKRIFKKSITETLVIVIVVTSILLLTELMTFRFNSLLGLKAFETSVKSLDSLFPIILFIFIPLMNYFLLTSRFKELIQKGITRNTFFKTTLIVNILQILLLVSIRLVTDYFFKDYYNINSYGLTYNYLYRAIIYVTLFSFVITVSNTMWLVLSKNNLILPNSLFVGPGGLVGFFMGLLIYVAVQYISKFIDLMNISEKLNEVLGRSAQLPIFIGLILIGIFSFVNYRLILQIDAR